MEERRIRLWQLFIWRRWALSILFLLVLAAINGFRLPPRLEPVFAVAALQCLAPISYLYFLRRKTISLLGIVAFSLEIVLITLLILSFGNDGYVFLLAYLWPLIMAGWLLGQKTVLPLALITSMAYGTLIFLRSQDLVYTDQILMPDGSTPQALILAALYLGFLSLLLWSLMAEKERGERTLDHYNRQLETLVQASGAIIRRQSPDELLHAIVEQAQRLMGIRQLAVYAREGDRLVLRLAQGLPTVPPQLALDDISTPNPQDDVLALPLRDSHGIAGALVFLPEPEQRLDDQTRRILEIYGGQAGISLENARLIADLQRETESLTAVLANMEEGVFVLGPQNQVLLANESAGQLLDLHVGQVAPSHLVAALREAPSSQESGPHLLVPVGERVISLSSATIPGREGQPENLLYVARDTTYEAQVQQMKSDFVAYASHELRTPLTTIKMLVGLLRSHQLKEAKQQEYLAIMETQVERQTRLINNLLDLTRLENGRFDLTPEPTSLPQVIEPILTALSPSAAAKEITLCYEPRAVEPVYANASGLEQIVTNLVSNAIKFTQPGGQVTVSCEQEDDEVRIYVRDTGIGMTPEETSRIFDKFYTARNPKKKGEGTGLGLAISQLIAQEMGGTIRVESEPGRGSTFILVLPRKIIPFASAASA